MPGQLSLTEQRRARIRATPVPKPWYQSALDSAKDIAGGIGDVVLPTHTLSDVYEGPKYAIEHPIESAKLLGSSVLDAQKQQFDKAKTAQTLSEKLGYEAAGLLPFVGPMAAQAGETFGKEQFSRGTGQALGILGPMLLGAKAAKGKIAEEPPPPPPPPSIRAQALLPAMGETSPGPTRFVAGQAGIADAQTPYRRLTGNPNPMIESGTPTLTDVGEVVTLPPELAAEGYGPQGAAPPSIGKQRTRAAQAAAEGLKAERARRPKLATPLSRREQLEVDAGQVGIPGFDEPGPSRNPPGVPSIERVTPQEIYHEHYSGQDPNVPGIGDVEPLSPETRMRLRNDGIETLPLPEVEPPAPKPKPKMASTTPSRLSRDFKGNEAIKETLKQNLSDRPFKDVRDIDLESLAKMGNKNALRELDLRKRAMGGFEPSYIGDVEDPTPPRLPIGARLADETGAVGPGTDALMRERVGTTEPPPTTIKDRIKNTLMDESGKIILPSLKPVDFDKALPGGGGKGNIFHRTVNPVFDKNFSDWVNARRATRIEGEVKRREFTDLDAAGMDGIHAFQAGIKSGRFADVADYLNKKHETLINSGVKLGFRENYLPQLWKNSSEEVFNVSKRLGLKPRFTIERVLENYQKGIEAGLTPKFETIGQLLGWYESNANKAIADRTFFDHLRETKQLLPSDKAPAEWVTLNPDNFPVQKFSTKKGDIHTKNYKAPKPIADAINNYLGEGHEAFKWLGDKGTITKNIVMSSGLPLPAYGAAADVHLADLPGVGKHLPDVIGKAGLRGTAINAHGFNIAYRNVLAKGIVKGGSEAARYLVNPRSAKAWFDESIAKAPEAAHFGLSLTTEGHEMGTVGSTHLLREPKTKMGKVLNRGFNAVLEGQGKLFEDPLFQNVVPALKLKHWSSLVEDFTKQGMSPEAAKTAAATTTNELYGGINWEAMQRSRDLQNLMRGIVLAPDWFETQYRIGKGMVNTIRDPKNPRGLPWKRTAANLLASYIAADVINRSINGKDMWDNEPGHTLDIKAGTVGGKTRYIRPFGTAADFARLPFDAIAGFKQGDLSAPGKILKNRMSTIARPAADLFMNQDPYGNPIFGKDKYGHPQSRLKQLGSASREVIGAVTPQYIGGPVDYATGKAGSAEEAMLGSVEAPVRYSRASTKKSSRTRSRRPSR